jgi:hypothetical protein
VKLDAGAFLLQWAAGGLCFGWVTTRRREVSLGYGWLVRITYGAMALAAFAVFLAGDETLAAAASLACALAAGVALLVSVVRRKAGAREREELRAQRRARVAAMIGRTDEDAGAGHGPEFPPALDLVAPAIALLGLFAAADVVGGPYALATGRLVVGALFLGSVTDAMLLGHWYLVQPGLRRDPLNELVKWTLWIWPFEVALWLWPTGMVQVFNGTVDDGYDGLLGWIWVVCAVTTIGLVVATRAALRERSYSAVMAATGLLYLAILTAFGSELLPRAILN